MKLGPKCPRKSPVPTASENEGGKIVRYWSCPAKLIHKSVLFWFDMREYERDFNVIAPSYLERPRRFLLMWSYFESKFAEYSKEMARREGMSVR